MIYLECGKDFSLSDIVDAITKEGRDEVREAILSLDWRMGSTDFTQELIVELVKSLRKENFCIKLKIDGEKF